ncbi:glycosyltransferase family 87 protein [Paraburkholderia phosphatilytica]|uniref:glycosyltransferase family 87 protein n=1 Tax=Paraburkholderia phosphatilytica TaxID=2282883 RepID=UPI001F0C2D0C|nr:glycosyltransferase family 87 protein [Paraburkholderia phosphatilytica]
MLRSAWSSWQKFGQPNGFDFASFWCASRLTLDGFPLRAYSYEAIAFTARRISSHIQFPGPWFYPPNFLLVVKPLALLPCPISYPIFAISTSIIFILLLRKIAPMRAAWLPILGFTGIWLNAGQGQNAAITGSLALGAFLLLEKRPALAGICIGLLSIKPHLAVLFPLALACAGMWTAFVSAAITASVFTGISIAVFSPAVIPVFLHGLSDASHYIANGDLPWEQTASLFAALRALHVPVAPAYAAQACCALASTCVVAWVWRRSRSFETRVTALVAGTFMVSPYIYNYDTAWLAIPVALLAVRGMKRGWLRWEREILLAIWLYPALGSLSGFLLHIGLGPFAFCALLYLAVKHTIAESANSGISGYTAANHASNRSALPVGALRAELPVACDRT